jgi:hypothetical protein
VIRAKSNVVHVEPIVVVPILLGRGVRLWDGLEGVEKNYEIEATSTPSGVTHVTFTRHQQLLHRHARDAGDHPASPYASW